MPTSPDDLVHVQMTRALMNAPDRRCISFSDGTSYTNAEYLSLVRRFSAGLQERGIVKGDRIVMMLDNRIEFLVCWLAAHAIGALTVPINTAIRGAGLKHQFDLAECKLAVIQSEWQARLEECIGAAPYLETLITVDDHSLVSSAWRASKRIDRFDEVYSERPPTPVAMHPSDHSSIMYSSGTTGLSKGVIWCHKSTLHMAESFSTQFGLGRADVVYACLPLFHTNALITAVITVLLAGGSAYISPRFSVSGYWKDIQRSKATFTNMLGTMSAFLQQLAPSPIEREHSLRGVFVSPPHADTIRYFRERYGVEAVSMYGLTDLGIFIYQKSGQPWKSGSMGIPLPEWEVRLVDDYDQDVPKRSPGECVARVREPWLMSQGYWRNPEATANAYRNLWFHTGDILRQDEEDGSFYFVDRKKDMIRRRGENVSALEVELAVARHQAVLECSAYALPSAHTDDEVAVAIVLRPGAELDEVALLREIEPDLPHFALPRFVTVVERLPKTETEKVQKAKLRALGVATNTWDREAANYKATR